jgi:hypothetical protein
MRSISFWMASRSSSPRFWNSSGVRGSPSRKGARVKPLEVEIRAIPLRSASSLMSEISAS